MPKKKFTRRFHGRGCAVMTIEVQVAWVMRLTLQERIARRDEIEAYRRGWRETIWD